MNPDTFKDSIQWIRFAQAKFPLHAPYQLSFTTLTSLRSLIVEVQYEDGRQGIGEVTPLPGYGVESIEDSMAALHSLATNADLGAPGKLRSQLHHLAASRPFAASAVASALDLVRWLPPNTPCKPVPLVFPLAPEPEKQLHAKFSQGVEAGFRTFKLKVGRDVQEDIEAASLLLALCEKNACTMRMDANQAYTPQDARALCHALPASSGLEWLEQPFGIDAWQEHERLCRESTVPIILDESISTAEDIHRAASMGCSGIKLKLAKHPGLDETRYLMQLAMQLGLAVTLGNGVGTGITNLGEFLLVNSFPECNGIAMECNGFAKLSSGPLDSLVGLQSGHLAVDGINELASNDVCHAARCNTLDWSWLIQ